MKSLTSATAPTSAASSVMSLTSRFFTWPSSCAMTAWSSSRSSNSSRPAVTATCDLAASRPVAKAFRIVVRHDPDTRARYATGDGHLLHDIHESPFLLVRGVHDLERVGRPQHALRSLVPGYERSDAGKKRQAGADQRKRVSIGVRRRLQGVLPQDPVTAEPEPCEERDERDDQQPGAHAVPLLLGEKISVFVHREVNREA
jgi:hypothetical protein